MADDAFSMAARNTLKRKRAQNAAFDKKMQQDLARFRQTRKDELKQATEDDQED